jgi:plastocyanin
MRAGVVIAIGAILALGAGHEVAARAAGVEIRLFQFTPARLDVARGAAVTWTNHDDIRHTVTSGAPDRHDGKFTATLDGPGATARISFSEPGVYPYFCDRHQAMRGAIHVL